MKNPVIFVIILLAILIFSFSTCGINIDHNMVRAAQFGNQPAAENANAVIFYGKDAGIGFDEMTLPVVLCGSSDTSYARMTNKSRATTYLNMVDENDVWVKMKLTHPRKWHGYVTKFEIIDFGIITPSEPAPCDCGEAEDEEEVIVAPPAKRKPAPKIKDEPVVVAPEPAIIKDDAPTKENPISIKEKETPSVDVKRKTDLSPSFAANEVEIITTIKVKGKVVSETNTNLGDVAVDASE